MNIIIITNTCVNSAFYKLFQYFIPLFTEKGKNKFSLHGNVALEAGKKRKNSFHYSTGIYLSRARARGLLVNLFFEAWATFALWRLTVAGWRSYRL